MEASSLDYDLWVEQALRGVVRRALTHVAERGLPGDHHFYLTVKTGAPGVDMPEAVRSLYPEEMTIVLQNQFWDLNVLDDFFEVTLSFGGVRSKLHVPYAALTAFADPAINFGLQMKPIEAASEENENATALSTRPRGTVVAPATPAEEPRPDRKPESEEEGGGGGEVIALDAFRKK